MSDEMIDVCDACEYEHHFNPQIDVVIIYLASIDHSHFLTKCPACDTVTRIWTTPLNLVGLASHGFRVALAHTLEPPPDIQQARVQAYARETETNGMQGSLEEMWNRGGDGTS